MRSGVENSLTDVVQKYSVYAKGTSAEKKAVDEAAAQASNGTSGAYAGSHGHRDIQQEVAPISRSLWTASAQPASLIVKLRLPRTGPLVSPATHSSSGVEASRRSTSTAASVVRSNHADQDPVVNNQLAVPQSLAQPSFLFRDAMATFAGQKGAQSGTTISLGQQFKQSPQRPQSSSDLVLAHLSSGGATELSPEFAGWKNIFRGFLAIREDVSAM